MLVLAQEEARRFNHSYVGFEHLLLGLVRENYCRQGSAISVELNAVRQQVKVN